VKASSSSTPPATAGKENTQFEELDPPVPSHLLSPVPPQMPVVNYKHLYLAHRIISRRIRLSAPKSNETTSAQTTMPMIIDAISSIEANGLAGHTEAIYALSLLRHPMTFTLTIKCPCSTGLGSGPGPELERTGVVVSGRDWLLTGSRDRTMRLWQLDCPKPRVVKVFQGGHTGSVLSLFTVQIKGALESPITSSSNTYVGTRCRVLAVTGGSDGKICTWDLEGDGSVENQVLAHPDSVLCVKGDEERIVSCSKGMSPFPCHVMSCTS
jgi:WD40 repeat protein